jgi:hypothetical protein
MVCVLLGSLTLGRPAQAEGGGPTTQQIAERAVRSSALGWSDARARIRMVLTDAGGSHSERALEVIGRKKNGQSQSLVRFTSPQDVAGTAFLLLEKSKDETEQYLYVPALKRTRRIAGRERDGSFMGSDFSYADLQGLQPSDGQDERLPDEKIGNDNCYVISSTIHANAKLPYGKVVAWIRQGDFIALRTKFFDRAGKLVKTLYSRRVKTIDGSPVVVEARMQNEQTNHTTEFFVDSVEHQPDLTDAQFSLTALEHL